MRRAAALVLLTALALASSVEARRGRPACSAGKTLFVEGKVRIFGVAFKARDESGVEHWLCVGTRRRAIEVGGEFSTTGTASRDTPAYALGGTRYLGRYVTSDSEGGPDAFMSVIDLRTRRGIAFMNIPYGETVPSFRVASDGTLIRGGEGLYVHRPAAKEAELVTEDGARNVALVGATVYWTDDAEAARSRTLPSITGTAEATMLEPAGVRRRAPCPRVRGTTVTASRSVRVVDTAGGRRLVCRAGSSRSAALGAPDDPRPRVVADRWVLQTGSALSVLDSRTGDVVTSIEAPVRRATMLVDGRVAWLDDAGRLLCQAPDEDAPTELAPAGASLLAAARRTFYWTVDGNPHLRRFPPP